MHKSCIDGVYELITPSEGDGTSLPLIFDSPHSGRVYPSSFDYACPFEELQRGEDRFVDELFESAPEYGAPLLCALFPRTYIDVNRARDDIDPELYEGAWPYDDDMPANPSNRSYAGIGLIRRLIQPNEGVYNELLSPKDIKSRIETYYDPYHNQLENLIERAHQKHGQVWHVNCHSMPSVSQTSGALGRINPYTTPDFVLGDRDGTSCDIEFTHVLRDFIKAIGYKVAINDPYKGVELVERYSTPADGRHSIQIEVSKALYLDESTYQKSKNYGALKADIGKLIEFCGEYITAKF